MYHASKPADWTDQAWIDWVHEELHTVLDKIGGAERSLDRAPVDRSFDYAVHMADPSARDEDFHREWDRHIHRSEQVLAGYRLELSQLILDNLALIGRLQNAAPDAAPIEIRTDLPGEEMVRIGEHFGKLLDPLAVNSIYAPESARTAATGR